MRGGAKGNASPTAIGFAFEKNLSNNASRKFAKYLYLTSKYRYVKFVNLPIGSLRIFGQSYDSFIQICSDQTIEKAHTNYIINKLTTIIIRTTFPYSLCAIKTLD